MGVKRFMLERHASNEHTFSATSAKSRLRLMARIYIPFAKEALSVDQIVEIWRLHAFLFPMPIAHAFGDLGGPWGSWRPHTSGLRADSCYLKFSFFRGETLLSFWLQCTPTDRTKLRFSLHCTIYLMVDFVQSLVPAVLLSNRGLVPSFQRRLRACPQVEAKYANVAGEC